MTSIHTRSRVGQDGKVVVSVGANEAGKEVFVTIIPAPPPMSRQEWSRFVERTAGSIPDPTFARPDQGSFESRESLDQ